MKALFLDAVEKLDYRETDAPDLPEGWVRVRMHTVGICGSDIHYFAAGRIGDQVIQFPHILGHEGSGTILDGAGALAPGTPVYVEPALPCYQCDQCRAERENTCRKMQFFGNPNEFPGCMREEVVVPLENAVPLPAAIPVDEGFLLEPLCIGMYSVVRSRFPIGGTAGIVGSGPIGLSVLASLGEFDATAAFVSDPVADRREAAIKLGAAAAFDPSPLAAGAAPAVQEASQGGVDVAFECAGTQESITDAVRMVKPGGTVMLVGIPETLDFVRFDPSYVRRNEITLNNVRRQNRMTERTLLMLEKRRDLKDAFVTHRFKPEQANEAFKQVQERRDGVIKAVLEF